MFYYDQFLTLSYLGQSCCCDTCRVTFSDPKQLLSWCSLCYWRLNSASHSASAPLSAFALLCRPEKRHVEWVWVWGHKNHTSYVWAEEMSLFYTLTNGKHFSLTPRALQLCLVWNRSLKKKKRLYFFDRNYSLTNEKGYVKRSKTCSKENNSWCACYLETEGLFGQPATGGSSVVLWGEGVGDAELLAHFLKGVVTDQPQVFQKLFPAVNGHEHPPLVSFILK